jgi:hypothetical protein
MVVFPTYSARSCEMDGARSGGDSKCEPPSISEESTFRPKFFLLLPWRLHLWFYSPVYNQ